jgi:hypothetical protein
MIMSAVNISKRLVPRYQSTLEVNESLTHPAIFGTRGSTNIIFISPSNPPIM